MSSPRSMHVILILLVSVTVVVPLNQAIDGLGLARHLHFMVIRLPSAFGMILGFSTNDGAKPAASSPPVTRSRIAKLVAARGARKCHGQSWFRSIFTNGRRRLFTKMHGKHRKRARSGRKRQPRGSWNSEKLDREHQYRARGETGCEKERVTGQRDALDGRPDALPADLWPNDKPIFARTNFWSHKCQRGEGAAPWTGVHPCVGRPTLEVKRNVGIALSEIIERVTSVVAAVSDGRVADLQHQHVSVSASRFVWHFDAWVVGDGFGALVPGDVGHWVRLEDALHDEDVAFLSDGGLFGEPRRFTVWDPVSNKFACFIFKLV